MKEHQSHTAGDVNPHRRYLCTRCALPHSSIGSGRCDECGGLLELKPRKVKR